MLFLKKTNKMMTAVLFLSLAVAITLDATMLAPFGNNEEAGDEAIRVKDSDHVETLEAGFWSKLWDTVRKVVEFSYCIITTEPLGWGEECFPIW